MHRTIKWMFVFSDFVAWGLVFLCIVGAIASPIAIPSYAKMIHNSSYMLPMVVDILGLLCVAAGAYALTRRNHKGLLLILVPCIIWLISGHVALSVAYGLVALTIFGGPLALSYRELLNNVQGGK